MDVNLRNRRPTGRAAVDGAPAGRLIAMPQLNTPFIGVNGQVTIPWYQLLVDLFNFTQPTGLVAGTYLGITFNVYGQATAANLDGITIEDVILTGHPTAPTPPAFDNSTAIATTAFVHTAIHPAGVRAGQYLQWDGDKWASSELPPFITDAPSDGQLYGRRNGTWVVIDNQTERSEG